MDNHEKFYEDEIAPALLALAQKCEEKGIPFVALCQYADDEVGRTSFVPTHTEAGTRMANWAGQSKNNFDIFVEIVRQEARRLGHNSTALRLLEEHHPAPFAPVRVV